MIAIIIRFFVLLRTKKIIRTILNVIHKNQKQLLLDIQDITSINGGAISILAHCVKIGSPIDVRQINMLHKRDRIARRKTSGRRMNTLALKNRGRYLRQRMPGNGKYSDIDTGVVEGSFMDMRLGNCREIAECRRKILSSVRLERDRSSKEIGLRSL
jgi:hypothetical protein